MTEIIDGKAFAENLRENIKTAVEEVKSDTV